MKDNLSILCASLMAGEGVVNGFTEKLKEVFTGGYYTINPNVPNFNEELLRMVKTYHPSIVFLQIQAPNIITIETAAEIAMHSFIINWSGDIRIETPPQWYLDIGKVIHLTAFSNMKDVTACKNQEIRSEWLECGVNPEIYRKHENVIRTNDIVAHFNHYGENAFPLSNYRMDIVKALSKEFGDRFGVFGNFPGAIGNFNSDQLAEAKNYSGAKLAINCSHFETAMYSSDRLSRIIATGGAMCLSHWFPDIEEMYDVCEHLDYFTNIPVLIEKCHYYLENENKRLEIVAAGQKHALENYTFLHMAQKIKKFYYI